MTITPRVLIQLSSHPELHDALAASTSAAPLGGRRRHATPTDALCPVVTGPNSRWSPWERARFLEGFELYPTGPWSHIAEYIGSKTARQAMTHAQKLRQRLKRQQKREEERRLFQEARQAAGASAFAPAETADARELLGADAQDDIDDALLSAIVAAELASPAPVDASHDEQQTNTEVLTVVNEAAALSNSELEDLLRWTDPFFEGFDQPLSEFEPLE